jgi:hypothetical protein
MRKAVPLVATPRIAELPGTAPSIEREERTATTREPAMSAPRAAAKPMGQRRRPAPLKRVDKVLELRRG